MKKIFVGIVLALLTLTVCACASSTTNNKQTVNGYSEFPFIEMTEDGKFNPDEEITWREALKMFEKNYKAIYDQTEEKLDAPVVRGEFMDYMVKSFNTLPAIATIQEPIKYSDISGHQYEDAINRLSSAGVIFESKDGKFYPDGHMTRLEVVVFLFVIDDRSLEWKDTGKAFSDISESHPHYKVIMNALNGK